MPSRICLLAIDQGTTSTRAILFDAAGRVQHTRARRTAPDLPAAGLGRARSGGDLAAVVATCREAIAAAATAPIAAIGITNQRETAVLWERAPAGRCTTRSSGRTGAPPACASAGATRAWPKRSRERTGLVIDPYFSASKIRWLLDEMPGLRERAEAGEIAFGTVDSFLLWRLTGGRLHATDVTNASRTMLFDLRRLDWDDELLEAFGIPRGAVARSARHRRRFRGHGARSCSARRSRSPGSPATSRRR